MSKPVQSIQDFRRKWGYQAPRVLIGKLITAVPEFTGKEQLSASIEEMVADLEAALRSVEP